MNEPKPIPKEGPKEQSFASNTNKLKSKKLNKASLNSSQVPSDNQEVLLRLPGGFEYKAPSKKQRIVIASIVLGLNAFLLALVGLYFYLPGFKDFIYNIGRS